MKVVIGVDPLRPPLTGIGRYTQELIWGLQQRPELDLAFMELSGRIHKSVAIDEQDTHAGGMNSALTRRARDWAVNSEWLARVGAWAVPRLQGLALSREPPDVYHSPNYFVPVTRVPTVATFHDLSHLRYPEFHPKARVDILNRVIRQTLSRVDQIIAVSEFTKSEIVELLGFPAERITVTHLGVSEQFRPRALDEVAEVLKNYGLTADSYCLSVGTLEPRKNLKRLLQAYGAIDASMAREYPLVVIGARGWLNQDFYEDVGRAIEQGWLKLLDYVSEDDLPFIYNGARLFIYPSIYEGFGLPVLEAMAIGVPVIASNRSSIPEVLGDVGIKVSPFDVDELSEVIVWALKADEWMETAKKGGAARAAMWTWDICVEKSLEVYEQLL